MAAALALRSNGAPLLPQVALLASLPFALTHVGPLPAFSFAAMAVAFWTALSRPMAAHSERSLERQ